MATKKNLTSAAQAATNHLFTDADIKTEETLVGGGTYKVPIEHTDSAQIRAKAQKVNEQSSGTKKAEKAVSEPKGRRMTGKGKKIDDTKVFSFRGWKDEVDYWRLYAAVKGLKIDELGSAAINEYIKRHPVTGAESDLQSALQQVRSRK